MNGRHPLGAPASLRPFDTPLVDLNGKSILVTGGTGSFGQNFVRVVTERFTPKKLIVFSRDELKQYEMAQRFDDQRYPYMRYVIGDVRDRDRLELAMREVDYVVHAAALKHVPVAERNPMECILTNVHGAENVVHAAIRCGVRRVIALSTDKAANPINLYGASKLASDKIFIGANEFAGQDGPRFSAVRYGNVAGSRGSVLPFFQKLIRDGADCLPITDPRMTRFWLTIRQGVAFVLSALAMMRGGEIFVPKIPSLMITDLARSLAPDLPHRVVGVRPGEKLHEIMIPEDDARVAYELDDRYVIEPMFSRRQASSLEALGGRPVPDGFCYASNTNAEWLHGPQVHQLVAAAAE